MKEFRILIWGLSVAIALVATLLIVYLTEVSVSTYWIIFLIIFIASLLFMFMVYNYLVKNDLKQIERVIRQMDQKSVFDMSYNNRYVFKRTRALDKTVRDISEKMSNEVIEFKKMAKFRKEFIANISHELKTPIFAAQGFVHTLLDGALKDKAVRTRFLKKAAKSLDALDLLVQDLLTLSQIEIGNVKMQYEYFDFRKIVSEVFEQLEVNAGKRGVNLKEECAEHQVLLYADYHKIYQVLTNLVQNGIKYNKEKGEVVVTTEESSGYYLISVSDTGEGIEKKHLDRIFERFYRVDKAGPG